MPDDIAGIEEAARSENEWVRARILKRDPPAEGSLLKIAQRARDMAANSLGTRHWAYAVALQNLGLYYDAIENDAAQANELYAQARAVVKESDLPLADGFYWLGIFHHQVSRDAERAQAALGEALATQRRALDGDDPQLADTMIALSEATAARGDIHSAIALMQEALRIQRAQAPRNEEAVAKTEDRLSMFRALASVADDDG
jgi:tetratricopeptide (TPR) repeat protein